MSRADIRDCINDLHDRLSKIESMFKITLNQEQKDLWGDLKRDIIFEESSHKTDSEEKHE